jgi:hypothetical protein
VTAVLRNTFSKDPFVTVTGDGSSLNETRQGGIPEEVADWAALAYLTECALAPIRHLRPADAGVCASRCGGGASDSKTLPETFKNDAHLTTFLTGRGLSGMVRVSDVPHRICRRFTPSWTQAAGMPNPRMLCTL